jgi:hypothetical protein
MARSEGKLLDFWISHHANLPGVKAIVLIDHLSTPPINFDDLVLFKSVDFMLFRYGAEPYIQAHVTNAVAKKIAKKLYRDSTFLPLDSDEFLTSNSVSHLLRSELKLGKFKWRHIWPVEATLDSGANSEFPPSEIFVAPNPYGGNKHFLQARSIRRGKTWSQGAHYVQNLFGVARVGETIGEIYHMPIRSFVQIYEKYSRGDSVHNIKQLSSTDSGERVFASHWKLDDLFLGDHETFVLKAMKDYYPYELNLDETSQVRFTELLGDK